MAERRSRHRSQAEKATERLLKKFGVENIPTEDESAPLVNPFTGEAIGTPAMSKSETLAMQLEKAALRRRLEAESVLSYVETRGAGFEEQQCKECGEVYAHTLMPVAYCSDDCRATALARIGVRWNPYGKTDLARWGGRIPKVLSPEALKAAKEAIVVQDAAFQIALQETLEEMDIARQEEEAAILELQELENEDNEDEDNEDDDEEVSIIFPTEEDEDD